MVPVPAVVSKARWGQAQEILKSRVRPKSAKKKQALCTGIIFCAEWGSKMGPRRAGPRGNRYCQYSCYGRMFSRLEKYPAYFGKNCSMRSFRQDEVDRAVWDKIEELITNPGTLWDAIYGNAPDERSAKENRFADLKRDLISARRREERAAQLFTMGLDPAVAKKQVESAVIRREVVEKELLEAKQDLESTITRRDLEERAYGALTALKEKIGDLSLDRKREVLRILIPGGPKYCIELAADGNLTIKGAIDFTKATSDVTPYCASGYDS